MNKSKKNKRFVSLARQIFPEETKIMLDSQVLDFIRQTIKDLQPAQVYQVEVDEDESITPKLGYVEDYVFKLCFIFFVIYYVLILGVEWMFGLFRHILP